jgi:hypothetical protein
MQHFSLHINLFISHGAVTHKASASIASVVYTDGIYPNFPHNIIAHYFDSPNRHIIQLWSQEIRIFKKILSLIMELEAQRILVCQFSRLHWEAVNADHFYVHKLARHFTDRSLSLFHLPWLQFWDMSHTSPHTSPIVKTSFTPLLLLHWTTE